MRVIVLGCGPAGLLAAAAVQQAGYTPIIISNKVPSPIGGAQYLHRAIPGVTNIGSDGVIDFVKVGTARGYATKVYGRAKLVTSWDSFDEGPHECWNLRAAYNRLWDMYGYRIVDMKITPVRLARLLDSPDYAAVMSTLPLQALCMNTTHRFESKDVYISSESHDLDAQEGYYRWSNRLVGNSIVWNGEPGVDWYRQSHIFGFPGTEFPIHPHDRKVVKVTKPLSTTCSCWPDLVRLGRYGLWTKGVLAHQAYEGAMITLKGENYARQ